MTSEEDLEEQLIEDIAGYAQDPLGYAQYAYPWGEGALEGAPGPKKWQAEELDAIGKHLRNPKTRFQPLLLAVGSGHGIGKSGFIAMVVDWAMSTCDDTKVVITANTEAQLRTKTWPEIEKWFKLSINAHWFDVTATAVYSTDPEHRRTWRADAVTWSEHNTDAFAGLHNKKKRIILIFDEGSSIADKVWEVAEGAMTDEDTEIIWIACGNITRNVGRFRECFGKLKHRWRNRQIDSRTVEGTNKDQIQKWIEDYGEDSDFVKVRVRGMPPSASFKQFISTDDVDAAYGRHLRAEQYNFAPKILVVDPAWEGDDEFVIGLRQGLAFKILGKYAKNDNDIQMAAIIARFEDEEKADAVFIDGGFGTGIVSCGKTWNRDWKLVWFAEKSSDLGCLNKRAEMYKLCRDWLKSGGAIPEDPVLHADLIGPEAVARLDGKIQIESKIDMKGRGLPSPNRGDALVLTFAYPVQAKVREPVRRRQEQAEGVNYNPLARKRA
jgi:hypothetical protein